MYSEREYVCVEESERRGGRGGGGEEKGREGVKGRFKDLKRREMSGRRMEE